MNKFRIRGHMIEKLQQAPEKKYSDTDHLPIVRTPICKPISVSTKVKTMSESAIIKTIDDLRTRGKLSGVDIANIANVSKATVSRWAKGSAFPHPKTQLVLSDLRYVVDRLSEFYTADETRVWLYARNDLLDGKTAMELINKGETDRVLQVIEDIAGLNFV